VAALAEVMGRSATMGVGSDDAVEAEAEAGAKPESAAMIDSGLEAGDRLPSGLYIEAVRPVRERLWLAGELD
jgi:hypothetical protein